MTRKKAIEQLNFMIENMPKEPPTECDSIEEWLDTDKDIRNTLNMAIKALEQYPCEDCISRIDALRVAKNEYLRGWHNALCKALSEKYSIHCEEGNFNVIQTETIIGLGLSMDCAVGKDVESYIGTMPRVTPQEPILDKIRAEMTKLQTYKMFVGEDTVYVKCDDVLDILNKYRVESEVEE